MAAATALDHLGYRHDDGLVRHAARRYPQPVLAGDGSMNYGACAPTYQDDQQLDTEFRPTWVPEAVDVPQEGYTVDPCSDPMVEVVLRSYCPAENRSVGAVGEAYCGRKVHFQVPQGC